MSDIKSFAVIGGDKRMIYCAKALEEDGFDVYTAGTGLESDKAPQEALQLADAVILPVPASRDNENIFAPLSKDKINAAELLSGCSKPVFYGNESLPVLKDTNSFCYGTRDDFKAANALPTAEGAIGAAVREYNGCITQAHILVVGFGRIGKVLSTMLSRIGAKVSVSARKSADIEMIKSLGMNAEYTNTLTGQYDIIFNTVPAMILDENAIASVKESGIIIDLASIPGGTDDKAAAGRGIRVFHELSLPGRTAPKAAGFIIKNTVLNVIEEEKL